MPPSKSKESLLLTSEDIGKFTRDHNGNVFIETKKGNFVFSDPSRGGDNTVKKFIGSFGDYFGKHSSGFFSCANKTIASFCGLDVKILDMEYEKFWER